VELCDCAHHTSPAFLVSDRTNEQVSDDEEEAIEIEAGERGADPGGVGVDPTEGTSEC